MRVTNRISRIIAVTVATSALAASVASCGAVKESEGAKGADESSPSASSSSPASEESPSGDPNSASPSSEGDNTDESSSGTTTPGQNQSPASPGSSDSPGSATSPGVGEAPGGADAGNFDPFRNIPESAKAKLDPTPLTQEEMQRGLQLPQEMMTKMVAGDAAGVCDMMVMSKDGTLVRFDVPEFRDQCAAALQTGIDSSAMKSMTPEQVKEASDPKHFKLHDNGDGTATFERDGKSSETKLARLDDGSLRLMVDNF